MKKKILSLALVVALIAIMVGGSLAYFTDNDQVTNTFTIGSVKIEIYENGEATDKDTIEFKDPLIPVVKEEPSEDINYIPKVVKVKNTGNNNAYVRTHIAVPKALVGQTGEEPILGLDLHVNPTEWSQVATSEFTTEDGIVYRVYTFDYQKIVTPDSETPAVLSGVYLPSYVDLEEDANGDLYFVVRNKSGKVVANSGYMAHGKNVDGTYTCKGINVLVASQAIQADGFSDAATALNSGFSGHPWAAK